jgi:hypothetical protein
MHKFFLVGIFLAIAQTGMAGVSPSGPSSYAATLDEDNLRFLKQLVAKVRDAGFREAQVVPQIFLVKATDKFGRAVTLLVNSDTNQAVEVEGLPPKLVETSPEILFARPQREQ